LDESWGRRNYQVGFEVAAYDTGKSLIIDPVLSYSTYLGSGSSRSSRVEYAIATDAVGHAYITGITDAVDFPTTPGAFQPVYNGGNDAFVTKFAVDGSALVYSTYLGGKDSARTEGDQGRRIAVDAAGHAYVIGDTASGDFPTTPEAFQRSLHGTIDGFITKLSPDGASLEYSTYLGGGIRVCFRNRRRYG
jgi:hypothetical protein